MDEMNMNMGDMDSFDELGKELGMDSFDELGKELGIGNSEIEDIEKTALNSNLKGFASCFPDWDLHPPV
jgi:hypothetical protein